MPKNCPDSWVHYSCGSIGGAICDSTDLSTDPKLGALASNGGFTQTRALLPGSSAIDAGDNGTCSSSAVSNLDQRGITRPQGAACDIGAFELVQYTIWGNVGLASATLAYRDGLDKTATSNASGSYSFTVSSGWSGTVTPSKAGYAFVPASRAYTNVTSNQTLQNYVPHVLVTSIVRSAGVYDGWILETGENTNLGGAFNSTDATFKLGDDATRKQYRAILSFYTAGLPDNAVITYATLTLYRKVIVPTGTNPFNIFQGLLIDVRKGFFSSSAALQAADFQAPANKLALGPYNSTPMGAAHAFSLPSTIFTYINKGTTYGGLTQLRLRFKLDDNNNIKANYISFYSGNYGTASFRPVLTIKYYLP